MTPNDTARLGFPSMPDWFNRALGVRFHPDEHGFAPPKGWKEPDKPPITPPGLDLKTLSDGKTVVMRKTDFDDDGHAIPAWHVLKTAKKADLLKRDAGLTDADLEELANVTGLSSDCAASMKPYWAKGLTARQIEECGVGYKLRMIQAYCACFSRALSRET